jgi:hypothetical protein
MLAGVDKLVAIAEDCEQASDRSQKIETEINDWLMRDLREHGVSLSDEKCAELLRTDVVLNTQGLEFWLDHRQ